MKTSIRNMIMTVIIAGACTSGSVMAHGAQDAGMNVIADAAVGYNDTAYAQAQSKSPQTASADETATVRVIYVDKAYGPAIYSYAGRAAELEPLEGCATPRWAVQ